MRRAPASIVRDARFGAARAGVAVSALALCAGCRSKAVFFEPKPGLERMLEQPRVDAYEHTDAFADGRSLRLPPDGALPYSGSLNATTAFAPVDDGAAPPPVTRALLELGQRRFETFCAPCHGLLGDGASVVARFMPRRPPSLHEPRLAALTPRELYAVIRDGYGLMPSYRAALEVEDRWAIVRYLPVLRLSQRTELARAPAWLQARIAEALP